MKITPINDLILIRRVVVDQPTTASGIILPPVEESATTPWQGVVVAVGPGKPAKLSGAGQHVLDALLGLLRAYHALPNVTEGPRGISLAHWALAEDASKEQETTTARIPMQIKVGDSVVFSKNMFQEFKIGGETLLAMGQDSILGVLE